ncbi:DNA-binding protein [Burkholderia pseudomallei]|uniref:DNA-binding protein n=1 Tax=Burkholderia pseudomallei TaxID=28450 RepID=UPI0009B1D898
MQQQQRNRGGRPGITVEDVKRACEALRQQGRPIGPVNVRLELGRGSYTTIIRALRALGFTKIGERKRKSPS